MRYKSYQRLVEIGTKTFNKHPYNMPDTIASPERFDLIVTLIILSITVFLFAWGKMRSDLVALCALLTFMLSGVLKPEEALSGFSNPIIMTIAGMFIVGGAIVRTGLAKLVSNRILKVAGTSTNLVFMLLMLIAALVGSLVSNTGTVAIMLPIVVSTAKSLGISPSRFLMPLAFMSGIGGMLTLVGNPGNMVVNSEYVKAGFETLTLFSFLPVGIVSMVVGILIVAPVTSFALSRRKNAAFKDSNKNLQLNDLADKYNISKNMYKVSVEHGSPVIGKTLAELNLTGNYSSSIKLIWRHKGRSLRAGIQVAPSANTKLQAGDTVQLIASQSNIAKLSEELKLKYIEIERTKNDKEEDLFETLGICELVIMSSSQFANITLSQSNIRNRFGITILGIQHGDQYIIENLQDQVLTAGDAVLVQGTWDKLNQLDEFSQNWVVVGRPQESLNSMPLMKKIPYVSIVIALMVIGMGTGVLPTVVCVMLGAALIILGKCYKNMETAYSAVNWETIIMIACMLPMAIAMEKAGIVAAMASFIGSMGNEYGAFVAFALVYAITSFLNIIISSTPVALLLAPVAIKVALDLDVSPLPFVFGVAAASSMCFASPFSTPSNALVMSAGRYTFFDYLKVGLPLQIVMGIAMVIALPLIFPFK